jgi:gliding motility-associated-like protein
MKQIRYAFSAVFLFLNISTLHAQYESANWYLHDITGLKFSCNPPKRFDINFDFSESCSISDNNGDVIIYSDAGTLWNRKGEIIQNGNIFPRSKSARCFPTLIPFPGKDSTYLFIRLGGDSTISTGYSNAHDIYYSVIDMKANNGAGRVVQKNINLTNNPNPTYKGYRSFSITGSPDRKTFWLATFFDGSRLNEQDYLVFYKIDASGIYSPAVYPTTDNQIEYYPQFSPAGNKIAFRAVKVTQGDMATSIVLYDFDFTSGIFSSPLTIRFSTTQNVQFTTHFEFSANGNFLYVMRGFSGFDVKQFDLRSNDENEINSSATIIFEDKTNNIGCYKPQLAIDGKIYFGCIDERLEDKRYGLWSIPNPNKPGKDCGGLEFFSEFAHDNFAWSMPTYPASFQFNDSDIPLNASLLNTRKLDLNWVSIDKDNETNANIEFETDTENFTGIYLYKRKLADTAWTNSKELVIDKGKVVVAGIKSDSTAYQFRIKGYDSYCQYETPSSVLNTIFLESTIGESRKEITLLWNPYDETEAEIEKFEIWKQSKQGEFQLYQTIAGSTFSFYDSVLYKDHVRLKIRIKGFVKDSDKIIWSNTIEQEFKHRLFIPNVITPNGDSKNEHFEIDLLESYPDHELTIFNKWGKKIYHSNGYNSNWRGEGISGTYYYYLIVFFKDGSRDKYKGWIQVVD